MAQIMLLVDDVDKRSDAVKTVMFALNGKEYEIDLSLEHAEAIEQEIGWWAEHARKRGTAPKTVPRAKPPAADADPEPDPDDDYWTTPHDADKATAARFHKLRDDMREWGTRNGWPNLGARGRIPRALGAAYRTHLQQSQSATTGQGAVPQFSDSKKTS